MDDGSNVTPDDLIGYLPEVYDVIAYNADGTKTAIFGAGSEGTSIDKMTFDLSENGCSKIEITFNKLPDKGELNYRQRIDVHLFNDPRRGGVDTLSLGLLRVYRKYFQICRTRLFQFA